jgi:hypothetical protein
MIVYEITAEVADELRPAYEQYMSTTHIPDLLRTGCFDRAEFLSCDGRYRVLYFALAQAAFDHYLDTHAAGLRDDFSAHFPSGVTLSRAVFSVVGSFRPEPRVVT